MYGFTIYVNEKNFNGYYGPFRKPQGQSWQNEFRIKVESPENDPFWFEIDDIHDISVWGYTDDLLNGEMDDSGQLFVSNVKE